jgi:hypothetical protein
MGGDGSATGGCRQQQNACYLTATPSAAGRLPPPLDSVTSRHLDFYHKCVDNGCWARVLYDVRDGLEKLTIVRRILPMPAPSTAPPAKRKPGCQASDRRRARDRRRREVWAESRLYRSQSRLHTPAAEETSATAETATTGQAVLSTNTRRRQQLSTHAAATDLVASAALSITAAGSAIAGAIPAAGITIAGSITAAGTPSA